MPTSIRYRLRLPALVACCLVFGACGGADGPMEATTVNSLFGTVRITNSEVLLEGVRVWVEGAEDRTRPNGGYALDGLELGETRVFAELPGHEPYTRRVLIREGGNTHDIFLVPLSPR